VVAPPRAGARLVAEVLSAAGCWTTGSGAGALLAPVPELDPQDGSHDGRLTAADCTPQVRQSLRSNLQVQFARRRSGPGPATPRFLHGSPRSALQVPFLDAVFPDAAFVYVHRQPADALAEALVLWSAGGAVTYPELPGWTGPAWSFLLVPGWQELIGRPLAEVVTEQWVRTMRVLADDLERLAPNRWCVVDHAALQRDPEGEAGRLMRYLELEPAKRVTIQPRTGGLSHASVSAARTEVEQYLDRTTALGQRAADWLADPQTSR
jgi:hypothetical protein